ncbi:MAG: hypothetical protein IJ662_02670 [Clostridia bacterium]|nr:hypothetical protein [Clostridia bacterium]
MDQQLMEKALECGYKIVNVRDAICDVADAATGTVIWRDAPLDDVRMWLYEPLNTVPEEILNYGMDLDRYAVVGHFWQGVNNCVLLMQRKKAGSIPPYCYHASTGWKYFRDFDSMMTYVGIRFGHELSRGEQDRLDLAYQRHRQEGTPIRWKDVFTGEG